MQPRLSLPEKTSTIWNEHERRSGLSTPFTKEGAPFQNLGAFLNKSNASSVPGQNASCRTAASVAAPSSKPDAMARKRRSAGASGRRSPATGHSSGLFPLVGRQRARQAQGCRRAQLASPLRRGRHRPGSDCRHDRKPPDRAAVEAIHEHPGNSARDEGAGV
jgi:hypothetical protein